MNIIRLHLLKALLLLLIVKIISIAIRIVSKLVPECVATFFRTISTHYFLSYIS